MPAAAFYLPVGRSTFQPTEHAAGPWNDRDQHAGPPAALLVRAIEQLLPAGGRLVRVCVDLLSGVPMAEVQVRARVLRPGRSVQLAEAELIAGGRTVIRATAWWHRSAETEAVASPRTDPPARPTTDLPVDPPWGLGGYLAAVDWVPVTGGFEQPGPATVWARLRHPLVDGEQPTGMQRLLAIADSGNGAGSVLAIDRWLFINTDLTVHAVREPAGEWICLDAATLVGSDGTGVTTSQLADQHGHVGNAAQALVIRPRPEP